MKLWSLVLGFLLVSCSSVKTEEKKVDDKLAAESTVYDGKSMGDSIREAIRTSATLDEKQKEKIESILAETKLKNKAMLEKSFKLRSVLIKELLSGQVNQKQLKLLKKQIRKTESLRLKTSLTAIDQISSIVKKDPKAEMYVNELMFYDRGR